MITSIRGDIGVGGHMSDLKLRQKNQGYGRRYFIIGSSRSKGSEIGAAVKARSGYFMSAK